MPQVFLSYKHEDLLFVQELSVFAQRQGVPIWLDTHIQPGEEWRQVIDTAIAESFAVVVIMTPEARLSEYITYEWAFAMGLRIPVIPVMLRPTRLHPKLEVLQYLDFTQGASTQLRQRLVERLQVLQSAQPVHPAQQPMTAEEEMRQGILRFFTSTPLPSSGNPGLIYGVAKDIIGQVERSGYSMDSVPNRIRQLRHMGRQDRVEEADNMEIALALLREVGLSSATHDLNQMFLRLGLPNIPKK